MVIPVQVGQGPELQRLNFSLLGFLGDQLFCWNEFVCGEKLKITQEAASYVLLYTIDCFAIYITSIYRDQGSVG